MTKERRLGRGLAALLGTPPEGDQPQPQPPAEAPPAESARLHIARVEEDADSPPSGAAPTPTASTDSLTLNVFDIDDNPFQPRREFSASEISSLAESLKEHELLQPILVRRQGDRYQLISGERRLRAAIQAGWTTIPARLREADDRLVAELAIVENLQRKDLNPIEKALSFRRYLDQHGCPQEELARRLKIDRATISNLMRLLELPPVVQKALGDGSISAGHARALLPLGDERRQIEFCRRIQEEGMSVRDTERTVRETVELLDADETGLQPAAAKRRKRRTQSEQVASLERELRIALGTKTEIRQGTKGRGRIVIHFTSHEEFERVHDLLVDGGGLEIRSQVG
ncbi:MAG: ParB/RepB/Spo0J family partition protein [Pirellulaceae bacterium]